MDLSTKPQQQQTSQRERTETYRTDHEVVLVHLLQKTETESEQAFRFN